ncbi:3459_t:CDS:2, partial [Scutellospora calospora]
LQKNRKFNSQQIEGAVSIYTKNDENVKDKKPVVNPNKTKPVQTSTNKKKSAPFSSYKPPLVKESKVAIRLTTTATISVSISAASTPDRTQSTSKYASSSARIF